MRDFIMLHYWANERDGEFWEYCRTMELPATLQRKIDLWRSNGRIFREDEELFSEESWIQVFLGQGVVPRSYDPLVAIKSDAQIEQFLGNIAATIDRCVDVMPTHDEYVAQILPGGAGRVKRLAAIALLCCTCLVPRPVAAPRRREMWLTTADETQKLAPQPALTAARRGDGRRSGHDRHLEAFPADARLRRGDDRCVGGAVQPVFRTTSAGRSWPSCSAARMAASACRSPG